MGRLIITRFVKLYSMPDIVKAYSVLILRDRGKRVSVHFPRPERGLILATRDDEINQSLD